MIFEEIVGPRDGRLWKNHILYGTDAVSQTVKHGYKDKFTLTRVFNHCPWGSGACEESYVSRRTERGTSILFPYNVW